MAFPLLHSLHFYKLLGKKLFVCFFFLARIRLENSRGYFRIMSLMSFLLREHF